MIDTSNTTLTVRREEYKPSDWQIPAVALSIDLHETKTRVETTLSLQRISKLSAPLVLNGKNISLISVEVDGNMLLSDQYKLTNESLTLTDLAANSVIKIITEINPSSNTELMGIYMSTGIFCSQCEAEGFRRIAYFLDRPDVMSRYTVKISAEKKAYPVLLSNGNLADSGDAPEGYHWARFVDPFPKPCYLFACVAGDLKAFRDTFTTQSGRRVELAIWVAAADLDRCGHAMQSLKNAMRWDEVNYGREYDLDVFHIVAVSDFNFGAMENKGLNIFNSKYILAKPETATDTDYETIESIVAHEYFHNWSGNRVTCRDWFQLSLKEGLTVYRDQCFSADQGSSAVSRIETVRLLRGWQYPEDSGPLAHPVRPDSYMEISNFYTATVYNKGAEVVHMLATLLGTEGYRRGTDLYFERHDGQAVTCDDFIRCMENANDIDLGQFKLWYGQAGTPVIDAKLHYDAVNKSATLTLRQDIPDTPGQTGKQPMLIPLRAALIGATTGRRLADERVIVLKDFETIEVFEHIDEPPVPSLLRNFSAPVILNAHLSRKELAHLAAHDDDSFMRYEAIQSLALEAMREQVAARPHQNSITVEPLLIEAFKHLLQSKLDPALVAAATILPTEAYIGDQMATVDVDAIHAVRQAYRAELGKLLRQYWWHLWYEHTDVEYALTQQAKARRQLKNACLPYMMVNDDHEATALCYLQFCDANNMTDQIAALSALSHSNAVERIDALQRFYQQWQHDPLVIDKWFSLQALSTRTDTLDAVINLSAHPDFTHSNPNRVRSLISAFATNQVRFHHAGGKGYQFLTDQVLVVDRINSQTAARLVANLGRWRRYDAGRGRLMKAQLERIASTEGLSKDVFELVSKSLV